MAYFKPGIFSVLAQMKAERLKAGKRVIDLSVGTPSIPPAQHIVDALVDGARDKAITYTPSATRRSCRTRRRRGTRGGTA